MINYREAIPKIDKKDIIKFLNKFDLKFEEDIDYTIIAEEDQKIVATGSLSENVLKCFAVDKHYQGMSISNTIITKLLDKAYSLNRSHLFIFTKPENENIFKDFGFKEVCKVPEVMLLDNKIECLYERLNELENSVESGAIVINANPMTKGHLKLIETCSKLVNKLYVFVVSEDKSIFPFKFRYKIVKEACKGLKNVEVIEGSEYIISRNTFPTYFYKDSKIIIEAYTKLDISIFAQYFAKAMNIKKRFVGTETNDLVTKDYNKKMKEILPEFGIELIEIERFKETGEIISASTVRKLIAESKFEESKKFLPDATIRALETPEGREIIEKLQKN
ncbi:[citrate (pro-3S)-lyase] ligase [Peptoniphilus olsenii]|uniref:[Citrate [pro-3S]-lyase] ligase n=1 Tax=Peptoniphilus olsenii TaxID=411570 RepID=A0ABV2JAP6_9FIRM